MPRSLALEDEEIILLDQRCRPEIQAEVDLAKRRVLLAPAIVGYTRSERDLVLAVLQEAEQSGKLVHQRVSVSYCRVCEKAGGYALYKRDGRYHRKGEPDRTKPHYLHAIELADRFVRLRRHVELGCCAECFQKILPALRAALADVRAEIPESVLGRDNRLRRFDRRRCARCGWEGNESEMGKLPALLEGTYPGICPKCDARNLPFGEVLIETIRGWDVVEVPGDVVR